MGRGSSRLALYVAQGKMLFVRSGYFFRDFLLEAFFFGADEDFLPDPSFWFSLTSPEGLAALLPSFPPKSAGTRPFRLTI